MGKVFLIDDDGIVIYLTKLIINEKLPNLEVVSFEYAADAIGVLQGLVVTNQEFPEYILLDINLPMMNGWDFLDIYQKFPSDKLDRCKLMMYTSSLDPADEIKSKTYNCVADFVCKPISFETLESVFSIK